MRSKCGVRNPGWRDWTTETRKHGGELAAFGVQDSGFSVCHCFQAEAFGNLSRSHCSRAVAHPPHCAPIILRKSSRFSAPQPPRAAPRRIRGSPRMARGLPRTARGRPRMARGLPRTARGLPRMTRGCPRMDRGLPGMTWGCPRMGRGLPGMTWGCLRTACWPARTVRCHDWVMRCPQWMTCCQPLPLRGFSREARQEILSLRSKALECHPSGASEP